MQRRRGILVALPLVVLALYAAMSLVHLSCGTGGSGWRFEPDLHVTYNATCEVDWLYQYVLPGL